MADFSGFHDVLFPLSLSFGATGGPERLTEIVTMTSGHERRNARLAHSRRRYDAGGGVRSTADLSAVLAFYEARRGPLHAFRFRDPFDRSSAAVPDAAPSPLDQALGTGDGGQRRFALAKIYGSGEDAYHRPVRFPVAGSLRVAVAGEEVDEGTGFDFDAGTGELVFAPDAAPGTGAAVTAGFLFDVPVRFESERLTLSLSAFKAGQIPSIPLVEVLP